MRHWVVVALAFAGSALQAGPHLERPFALSGPEVTKLDWNTRALVAADLDGDKRLDLAVLNNDRARIDLLFQRAPGEKDPPGLRQAVTGRWDPVLEDARFRKGAIVTGQSMWALAAGDFDGDGLTDLAATGAPDGLVIRYQQKGGEWSRTRAVELSRPSQQSSTLAAGDLDADGRTDLVVMTQEEILVLRQIRGGELAGPVRYGLCDREPYGLILRDVNGDNRPDIVYLVANKPDPLRVRFQDKEGRFGAEFSLSVQAPRAGLVPVDLVQEQKGSCGFALIQGRTGLVEIVSVGRPAGETRDAQGEEKESLFAQVFPVRMDGKSETPYAFGDFDGDGRIDLAAADVKGAQMLIYFQHEKGVLSQPEAFPALSDISAIAAGDLDRDGRAELVMASSREKSLAVSVFSEVGRMAYPRPVPLTGVPSAVAVMDADGDGALEVLCVKEEERKRFVCVCRRSNNGEWAVAQNEIADLRADPSGMRGFDADGDGHLDLMIFVPHDPARLLKGDGKGTFVEVAADTAFRKGLVDRLSPSEISLGDVDGDGKDELLVARTGFARSLRMEVAGGLDVVDQYHAADPEAAVGACLAADIDADKGCEILLLGKTGEWLLVLRKDSQGVFRPERTIPMGRIDLVGAEVRDLEQDGKPDLFFFGKDRFWWIPAGRQDVAVSTVATYETDLKGVAYADAAAGDLNGDGRQDLVLLDGAEGRILEILSKDAADVWRSRYHFRVFEANAHYEGRRGAPREPREMLVADLTGDGKDDLLLLCHDRILLYPQEQ